MKLMQNRSPITQTTSTTMPAQFQIKPTRNGQYHFNLKAPNGEIILTSETYIRKASAHKGIQSIKTNAPLKERFETRKDKRAQPYFVLKARNHQIIGTSETYSGKTAMKNGIRSVMRNAPGAPVVELSPNPSPLRTKHEST